MVMETREKHWKYYTQEFYGFLYTHCKCQKIFSSLIIDKGS